MVYIASRALGAQGAELIHLTAEAPPHPVAAESVKKRMLSFYIVVGTRAVPVTLMHTEAILQAAGDVVPRMPLECH